MHPECGLIKNEQGGQVPRGHDEGVK